MFVNIIAMSTIDELLKETLPDLDIKTMIDVNSLHSFYKSRYDGNYHNEIWDYICDYFVSGRLCIFSVTENPKNKAEELINEFLEAYPELGDSVRFYFSD